MVITETTRAARVKRWQNLKSAWEAKSKEADNENDKNVAAAMIAEADGMIKRLESNDEQTQEEDMVSKDKITPIMKKAKASHKKRDSDIIPEEEGSISTLGS